MSLSTLSRICIGSFSKNRGHFQYGHFMGLILRNVQTGRVKYFWSPPDEPFQPEKPQQTQQPQVQPNPRQPPYSHPEYTGEEEVYSNRERIDKDEMGRKTESMYDNRVDLNDGSPIYDEDQSQKEDLCRCDTPEQKKDTSKKNKILMMIGGLALGAGIILIAALENAVKAGELELHPPKLPWSHKGYFQALDHASVRRGYEVFKQVCCTCHSLRFVAYRDLVGVTHSEAEAKAEAEEQSIKDGPDETGEMFERPGKLSDYIPKPYENEEQARFANGGAYPPDLTYIIPGRHNEEDYIFHLLTGYCDPPQGVTLKDNQYYNPYFAGGVLGMAPPISEGVVEFSDGTTATVSQCAKDVVTFLKWTSEPEHDIRKAMLVKVIVISVIFSAMSIYWKRMKWSTMKSRKLAYHYPKKQK